MAFNGLTNIHGWIMAMRAVGMGGESIGNSGYVECNKCKLNGMRVLLSYENNKMRSSDIDIVKALYTKDTTHLRLSPKWKLLRKVDKGEGADVSLYLEYTHIVGTGS